MNLCDQRSVDEASGCKNPVIVPMFILLAEAVANGIVFQRKECMEQAESHPPVVVKPGEVDSC